MWEGDNLIQVIDPDGNVTTYGHDSAGHVISITDALGNTLTRTFDEQGRLSSETNRNGLRREFSYDNQSRLVVETWYAADGTTVVDQIRYTYDSLGRLATAGNNAGTYTFSYDEQNRVVRVDGPFGLSLTFAYDANGNRVLVQDSLGGSTSSTYDSTGNLLNRWFSQDGRPLLGITQSYNADGAVSGQNYLAGDGSLAASSALGYDPAGDLSSIEQTAGDGTLISGYNYGYDKAGDLSSESDSGTDHNYGYDGSGELTGADGQSQSYDSNGNRSNAGYVTGPDNRLLSDGVWDYRYDNEGNLAGKTHLITGETWDYGYDHLNRMLSAEHRAADGTLLLRATYRYDVFGHRIEQSVFDATTGETTVTRFAYNGDELYAVLDGNNQLVKRYVSLDGPDSAFARVAADGTVVFLLRDRLGSVRDVVSDQGVVLDHVDFDAWGNVSHESNPAAGDQIKYAGYWQDTAVGLYQVFHRWYDPTIGRWLSKDPTGFDAGDSDLYRYVGNGPTNATDPSGLQKLRQFTIGAQAVINGEIPPGAALDSTPRVGPIATEAFRWSTAWAYDKTRAGPSAKLVKAAGKDRERIENAARHMYWQAMLTIKYGSTVADTVGAIHEIGESSLDSLSDEYNNTVGQVVGHTVLTALLKKNKKLLHRIPPQQLQVYLRANREQTEQAYLLAHPKDKVGDLRVHPDVFDDKLYGLVNSMVKKEVQRRIEKGEASVDYQDKRLRLLQR